ncbi:MAG: VIT domain-containing protein [Polyangiaceae bacterium]
MQHARASFSLPRWFALTFFLSLLAVGGCDRAGVPLAPKAQTWAELRVVRRDVKVQPPDGEARAPYPRERLVDGATVSIGEEGVAWIRRDAGATFLVHGPAKLTLRPKALEVSQGKLFVDTPGKKAVEIETPSGPLTLSQVRASIDVAASGVTQAYVLSGEVRAASGQGGASKEEGRAGAGELLTLQGKGAELKVARAPVLAWDDWTGGLATTDRAAQPAPYGVGTVGARPPGSSGAPRFPLAIERLDVRVTIDGDFATTEVDQVFFNPSSQVVEGIYRFRTPEGASLHKFGVDRGGAIVWGRVKEKQAASRQYESNVYAGSTEDPALLEWEGAGVYKARLYPIGPGEARRVVVRYAEWLGRTGSKGERRLYVYPMAAEGAEGSLPAIEELSILVDLARAGAKDVRAGMSAARAGNMLVVRDHDVVPRADLAVELFDDGAMGQVAFTAPHTIDLDTLPPSDRDAARKRARDEADYVIVPVRATDVPLPSGGLDLAIVVDASAATDGAELALARAQVAALLAHLGKEDRAVVWAGDVALRPVVKGRDKLATIDDAARREIATGMAQLSRGGATDLGAVLSAAAAAIDPARRGAVVYIGDGVPTVGELSLKDLRERLSKLPKPVRIFGIGVGDGADMAILSGLARAAFAERVGDANAAARVALRLFELAERPAWLGAKVDLGSAVERVFPRDLGAQVADETLFVLGRMASSGRLTSVTLSGPGGDVTRPLTVSRIEDGGDLRRRWAEAVLYQMMDEAAGRAAMVDLGVRHGIITPVTSLYVPTTNEMSPEERAELANRVADERRSRLEAFHVRDRIRDSHGDEDEEAEPMATAVAAANADDKEGGTGTRAKGEEGSMGRPASKTSNNRYGVAGPPSPNKEYAPRSQRAAPLQDPVDAPAAPPPPPAEENERKADAKPSGRADGQGQTRAVDDAQQFGMIGLLSSAGGKPGDPARAEPAASAAANAAPAFAAPAPTTATEIPPDVGVPAGGQFGDVLKRQVGWNGTAAGGGGVATGTTSIGIGNGYGAGFDRNGDLDKNNQPSSGEKAKQLAQSTLEPTVELDSDGVYEEQKGLAFRAPATADISVVSHVLSFRCSAAASLPIEERAALWRERLAETGGNAAAVASVYLRALATCEAPALRERTRLLHLMLDATKSATARVQLWRRFMARPEGDTLYRGMLARVRTPEEMRDLHAALGLRSIDAATLKKLLDGAGAGGDRIAKLRSLVREWPDDFALALLLLDTLEDAGDDDGARDLGRKLRARPDADTRLRTAVGELFLRLAARAKSAEEKAADEAEARRAFGEIVEFAPDDPVARRRLGDLLRAHGWHEEAARQYETLAKLTPDDPAVYLLLAAAADGLGKLEEAVKWTEKAGASGAPDMPQSAAQTARALALTYLAWERDAARKAGRKDDVEALTVRAERLLTGARAAGSKTAGTRATLVWSHPDLHPTLWSNALGAAMPAPEQDMTAGVAQAVVPRRDDAFVEVRIDPEDAANAARLGATATLTILTNEGEASERIRRVTVKFGPGPLTTQRFVIAEEVSP